jgi:hypothetical protein
MFTACLLVVAACSGGDSGIPQQPPIINFTMTAIGVPKSSQFDLTVSVDDLDGDPLKVT